MSLTLPRARGLVLLVALAAYANSLGNGFAYDDNEIVVRNPVVTGTQLEEAVTGPYWNRAREGSGLYRPVTVTSFALEWRLFDGSPLGFHAVNVLAHAGVSLLVLSLLLHLGTLPGALAGALFFAVHPVHVEAVANVVGRAELYAAAAVVAACLLYLRGARWGGKGRALRLGGLALLYLVGLGSKEIAVTLPGVLLLLEFYRDDDEPLVRRLRSELPVYLSLAAVLGGYLLLRWAVLGTVAGEVPAPALRGLGTGERVLTALTVWPEYLRLMLFPVDLSADYAPAVLLVATGVTLDVVLGALVLAGLLGGAWFLRSRAPLASLGILWFGLTVLPVSNLVIPAGVLLAERTLYLPSVGAALALAAVAARVAASPSRRAHRWAVGLAAAAGLGLMARTVDRNPTWMSTYTVLNSLAVEHPESFLALRARAAGLERVGEVEDAGLAYRTALELVPQHYGLRVEVAEFRGRRGDWAGGLELLRQAAAANPDQPEAWELAAEYLLRLGRGREAFQTALEGMRRSGPTAMLWSHVSEAYVAKGDLEAALRARRTAAVLEPDVRRHWLRLAELLEALDRPGEAVEAREQAERLPANARSAPDEVGP